MAINLLNTNDIDEASPELDINDLVVLRDETSYIVTEMEGQKYYLNTTNYTRKDVWGIRAKNVAQNYALNLLMDSSLDLVMLQGPAGTGKTLLSLAAALVQVFDNKNYNQIIITRATIPVGQDIGFLPGTEEEKLTPWMGAFNDNLEVLTSLRRTNKFAEDAMNDIIKSKIKFNCINFMRGRSFVNKYIIIDEAQNLTQSHIKTIITRAGEGSKIVCLGDIDQIDHPKLNKETCGLTYLKERFKGWRHGAHVELTCGERSRLASYAAEVL